MRKWCACRYNASRQLAVNSSQAPAVHSILRQNKSPAIESESDFRFGVKPLSRFERCYEISETRF
jgi:hypothetical protein